jgi:DNA-binding LacI/PurR family transcriptional regulator
MLYSLTRNAGSAPNYDNGDDISKKLAQLQLERGSKLPLHQQLFSYYQGLILAGELPEGSKLPTELELSKKLQISRGTVRQALQALNDAGLVSRKTKLGTVVSFSPQQPQQTKAAVAQDGLKRRIIGGVFPELDDRFALDILQGIQATCAARGYHLVYSYSKHSSKLEQLEINRMQTAGFAGVLVLPHDDVRLFKKLHASNYPFVLIDQEFSGLDADYVGTDNYRAAFRLTEVLIQQGHKRVAFAYYQTLGLPSSVHERLEGYRAALRKYQLEDTSELQFIGDEIRQQQLFVTYKPTLEPLAVVAASGYSAYQLVSLAMAAGLNMRKDVALAHFDSSPLTAGFAVATMHQPGYKIGSTATELLFEQLEQTRHKPRKVMLPGKLELSGQVSNSKVLSAAFK